MIFIVTMTILEESKLWAKPPLFTKDEADDQPDVFKPLNTWKCTILAATHPYIYIYIYITLIPTRIFRKPHAPQVNPIPYLSKYLG